MYLRCYKMALMGFGYLLIQNSSFVKETFEDYLVEKQRFHIYYKKKFPFFFYGLPVTGLGSFIGIMYTLSCIDIIFKDMISQVNATWYKASQISEFETQLYVFAFIFFSSLFIRLGISLYVIKKC